MRRTLLLPFALMIVCAAVPAAAQDAAPAPATEVTPAPAPERIMLPSSDFGPAAGGAGAAGNFSTSAFSSRSSVTEELPPRPNRDRLAVLREGECEETASGYSCANSGRLGNGQFERESNCTETATGRSCGGSVTWGTSSGTSERARSAAQDYVDRALRD